MSSIERDSVVMGSTWLGNDSEEEGEVVGENKELDGVGSMGIGEGSTGRLTESCF